MITYRGYQLHDNALAHGHTHIHDLRGDFIGTAPDLDRAKEIIDDWQNAR